MFRDKKNLFLTYPQCPISREDMVEHFKNCLGLRLEKYVVSQEQHQDGNFHIHAFLQLNEPLKTRNMNFFDLKTEEKNYHPNLQTARCPKAVKEYVIKDDENYLTNIPAEQFEDFGKTKAEIIQEVYKNLIDKKTTLTQFTKENPTFLPNYEKIQRSLNLFFLQSNKAIQTHKVRGIWIHGLPDSGKSHLVRQFFRKYGEIHFKSQNKWFDGYNGESFIILDDFDFQGKCLSHYLKIWADKFPCSGEVKGSTVPLMHKYFIITSNYTIDQLWPDREDNQGRIIEDNSDLRLAITRRFQIYERKHKTDPIPNFDLENLEED